MFKKIILGMMLLASPAMASDMKVQMLEPTVKINNNCSATLVDLKSADDFLLTARHCVKGTKEGFVSFVKYDGTKTVTESRVYYDVTRESSTRDLALLKLREPIEAPKARIGNVLGVEEGSDVWVVGYPLGWTRTITKGLYNGEQVITKAESGIDEDTVFTRSSPAVTGGNSGGGLYQFVDNQYELVGVTSMSARNLEHISLFVTLEDVRRFLNLDVVKPVDRKIDNQ